jgi:low temperature requirement protein LtrA
MVSTLEGVPMPRRQEERHPSWLELFFDLVLVAAVAALGRQLHADHSALGIAIYAGLFVPVWWVWRGFAWYATGFAGTDRAYRWGLLLGTLTVAVLAAGVPGVAQGDSTTFVVAYAAATYVLVALYVRAWYLRPDAHQLIGCYVVGDAIGASLWLVSLALSPSARPVLWVLAMLVLIGTPLVVTLLPGRARNPGHIAERYGLFTLIVLGESVTVTVTGFGIGGGWDVRLIAVLGFGIAASIWWVYFDRWRSMPLVSAFGRFVWAQMHVFVFAGIAASAVGIVLLTEAAATGGLPDQSDRAVLGLGLAAYLGAMAAIRGATRRVDWVVLLRAATGALILIVALLGLGLGPTLLVALCCVLMATEASVELTLSPPPQAASA